MQLAGRSGHCTVHGMFTSRHLGGSVWTKCPDCMAAQIRAEAEARAAAERLQRQQAWQRRIGDAGVPERFRDRTFSAFVAETDAQRHALAFAQDFAGSFAMPARRGRSALFVGKPGTGKTHLAAAIAMALLAHGHTVLFATVLRALRGIKDTWSRTSSVTEAEAVARLTGPDLLILDEVGIQTGSAVEGHLLFDVLNERYERRRSTLLLSNLPLAEVRDYLGQRIFDRLREDGGEQVVFDWDSHRGRIAAAGAGLAGAGATDRAVPPARRADGMPAGPASTTGEAP
nr:MAG TPA: Replicative helicase [Caudoviricetes sp.]